LSARPVLLVLAAAVLGVLAWDLTRSPAVPAPAGNPAVAAPAMAKNAAALSMSPPAAGQGVVAPAANFLRPASVSPIHYSPLAREFRSGRAWKALHDRLRGSAEGESAEGQYLLYRILRACATVADRKGGARSRQQAPSRLEERRAQIAASLPEGDPRLAQRLAAFDKVSADQCEGFAGMTVTEADLAQLLRNAVAGGDPKARAWQVEQEMWQERRSAGSAARAGATLSDPQLAVLKEALATKDPEAIVIAGRILAGNFRDITVRAGPDQEPIENRTFMNAALLLACEYGYPCDENNQRVLAACAFQGHCGVASLPDYLFFYGASPYDAQLLDRYRGYLRRAADAGDWSGLTVQRGVRSPNAPTMTFHGMAGR